MSESGVIPPPEERWAPRYIGSVHRSDGWFEFAVSGDRVRLSLSSGAICLAREDREEFMRLWQEAERQAEAAMPP